MDNYEGDVAARLSLCDLPLTTRLCDCNSSNQVHKTSPSDHDLFEFISDNNFINHANDHIIFCGKLTPFKTPQPADNTISTSQNNSNSSQSNNRKGREIEVWSKRDTLVLGMRRFQMGKMELSDMKARQRRKKNSMKKRDDGEKRRKGGCVQNIVKGFSCIFAGS